MIGFSQRASAFGPIIAFVSSLAALGDSVVPINKLKVT